MYLINYNKTKLQREIVAKAIELSIIDSKHWFMYQDSIRQMLSLIEGMIVGLRRDKLTGFDSFSINEFSANSDELKIAETLLVATSMLDIKDLFISANSTYTSMQSRNRKLLFVHEDYINEISFVKPKKTAVA